MFLVSSWSCLCPIQWSQVLRREWRCSWNSAHRGCANYIWVIDNFIAYLGAAYIRDLTVIDVFASICGIHSWYLFLLQPVLFFMSVMQSKYLANAPISWIPWCSNQLSHNVPFCNKNVHKNPHFCFKIVHCGIWNFSILGFMHKVYCLFSRSYMRSYTNHSSYLGVLTNRVITNAGLSGTLSPVIAGRWRTTNASASDICSISHEICTWFLCMLSLFGTSWIITIRPTWNDQHFTDYTFKCIFLYLIWFVFIQMTLQFFKRVR